MVKFIFSSALLLLAGSLLATPAPNFTVTTSDGVQRNLYQDYINTQKVVVIEAFFTTCPPCSAHAPYLQALYQSVLAAHPGQVEFLLLSTLSTDTNAKVAQYKADKGLSMPAAGAQGGSTTALQPYISGQFGQFLGTPTFIVIAPGTGEVYFDIRGNSITQTMNLLDQKINEVLPKECFLKSYFDNLIDSVQISVTSPGFSTNFMASGFYSVSSLPQLTGTSYNVAAHKFDYAGNGVSTYDLVKISKHILGIELFAEPWQMIAADVNCSNSVTTTDILHARKLILGITDTLPCGSWRFLPDPDTTIANGACLNFRGVKMGDVSGPYLLGPPEDRTNVGLFGENKRLEQDRQYDIQIAVNDPVRLQGLQLGFGFDPTAIAVDQITSSVLPGLDEQSYHIQNQSVRFSWITESAEEIQASASLITLRITALKNGRLSDVLWLDPTLLRPELYGKIKKIQPLELIWQDAPQKVSAVNVFPNPARHIFNLGFESAREGEVLLQMLDNQGKMIFQKTETVVSGSNKIEIQPGQPAAGLYFLKLDGKPAATIVIEGN